MMLYAVIKIEAGAIPNITALLKSFNTGDPKVEGLIVTTGKYSPFMCKMVSFTMPTVSNTVTWDTFTW